jgi:hypothetical protein
MEAVDIAMHVTTVATERANDGTPALKSLFISFTCLVVMISFLSFCK